MTNLKQLKNEGQDTYLVKLKELVPVYIIALVSTLASFIEFAPTELTQLVAIVILVIISGVFTFFYEKKLNTAVGFPKMVQVIFVTINAVAWILMVNLRFISLSPITDWIIRFIVAIWTVLNPYIYELFTK
ncbi:MAG: hypothetical protein ACFFE5_11355 [Candidatus Thorarchaeota archaeon]